MEFLCTRYILSQTWASWLDVVQTTTQAPGLVLPPKGAEISQVAKKKPFMIMCMPGISKINKAPLPLSTRYITALGSLVSSFTKNIRKRYSVEMVEGMQRLQTFFLGKSGNFIHLLSMKELIYITIVIFTVIFKYLLPSTKSSLDVICTRLELHMLILILIICYSFQAAPF